MAVIITEKCKLCPRNCGKNRQKGEKGVCSVTDEIMLARAALHFWEEPCISGSVGSGTVFFSGCPLRCVYCQNSAVASAESAKKVTPDRLARIFVELQNKGAANINLVTPDHYVPQIIGALVSARADGLNLPVVYNTSSYVMPHTVDMMKDHADIYLADYKYHSADVAARYSHAADYPVAARAAIARMTAQCGSCEFDSDGMMRRGVIVRHLVLPGHVAEAKRALRYIYETYGDSVYISIMSQFTPCTDLDAYPEINRRLTAAEYDRVIDFAVKIGVKNAFVQDGKAASESFIPMFDYEGV